MTREELAAIKALADAATPGPWSVWDGPAYVGGGRDLCIGAGDTWLESTAHFIAAARTAVPALLAEVERLRADAERWAFVRDNGLVYARGASMVPDGLVYGDMATKAVDDARKALGDV